VTQLEPILNFSDDRAMMKRSMETNRPLSHQLIKLFGIMGPAYARWLELVCGKSGTTPQRLKLVVLLCENGPTMMSGLRDQMGLTGTAITALVDALEKDGRVIRKKHPTDRRGIIVEATQSTRKLFDSKIDELKDEMADIFAIFNSKEQMDLLSLLERLREAFVERGILGSPDSRHQFAHEKATRGSASPSKKKTASSRRGSERK
jgi:DNA-binding MarR family transcriptional regulator